MESLDEFTEVETLKDDNAYFCEKCASKQTAEKSIKFRNLPTVLNIQLKRYSTMLNDLAANSRLDLNMIGKMEFELN